MRIPIAMVQEQQMEIDETTELVECEELSHCFKEIRKLSFADLQLLIHQLRTLRNLIVGNSNRKLQAIRLDCLNILNQIFAVASDDRSNPPCGELLIEASLLLCTLAKGPQEVLHEIGHSALLPLLLKLIVQQSSFEADNTLLEALLRALRSLFASSETDVEELFSDVNFAQALIEALPRTSACHECVTGIFAGSCRRSAHQHILCDLRLIDAVAPLICSSMDRIKLPTLQCLTVLSYKNPEVSSVMATTTYNGEHLPNIAAKLLSRDHPLDIQLAAAKCLTNMYRAGVLSAQDKIICLKTLPTLAHLCQPGFPYQHRIDAAETLAYLIEMDMELQSIASVTERLAHDYLEDFLKPKDTAALEQASKAIPDLSSLLKAAAYRLYASLASSDEEIRKNIISLKPGVLSGFVENLVSHLEPETSLPVRIAALRCLHSLSRSVHQLRTNFRDHRVWKPLVQIIITESDENLLNIASATICNLVLEFSPSKEPMLELGIVDIMAKLTRHADPCLRLNGVWALMNMAFQAEEKVKKQIFRVLRLETSLYQLLYDNDVEVTLKALGLVRNLLSTRAHVDYFMTNYGEDIMQAIKGLLENELSSVDVIEQTLCILGNIANGDSSRTFLMNSPDVLKKILFFLEQGDIRLQISATLCISNLVWNEEEGAPDRQVKLRELGFERVLKTLRNSPDSRLYDRVKTVLHQLIQ